MKYARPIWTTSDQTEDTIYSPPHSNMRRTIRSPRTRVQRMTAAAAGISTAVEEVPSSAVSFFAANSPSMLVPPPSSPLERNPVPPAHLWPVIAFPIHLESINSPVASTPILQTLALVLDIKVAAMCVGDDGAVLETLEDETQRVQWGFAHSGTPVTVPAVMTACHNSLLRLLTTEGLLIREESPTTFAALRKLAHCVDTGVARLAYDVLLLVLGYHRFPTPCTTGDDVLADVAQYLRDANGSVPDIAWRAAVALANIIEAHTVRQGRLTTWLTYCCHSDARSVCASLSTLVANDVTGLLYRRRCSC